MEAARNVPASGMTQRHWLMKLIGEYRMRGIPGESHPGDTESIPPFGALSR